MKTSAKGVIVLAALVLATGLAACTYGEYGGALKPTSTPAVQDALTGPSTVEVLAPIDKVDVLIRESWPPQYAVEITSGLPSGCARFERIAHVIKGDRIEVEVINTEPAPGELVACTAIYGYAQNTVELGTDFEAGVIFTVSANGVETSFVGQGGPNVEPPAGTTGDGYETVEVAAPIDRIEILIMESFPVQYAVSVVSGLPGGCARFERITHAIKGDRIEIEVINTMPAPDELVACTRIYGYAQNTVELGTDFQPGTTYTVAVNGAEETFVAQ